MIAKTNKHLQSILSIIYVLEALKIKSAAKLDDRKIIVESITNEVCSCPYCRLNKNVGFTLDDE